MKPAPRSGLAVIPVVAFLLFAPLFALAHSLAGPPLSRPTAHRLVADLRLAERAGGWLIRLWFDQSLISYGSNPPAHLRRLSPATWDTIAAGLLPPGWLEAELHRAVDALYDWLAGSDPWPAVQVDLAPVRARLRSPAGANALLPLLAEARACLPGEFAPIEAGVFVPCLPPNANLEALARQSARLTAGQMPPMIDVPTLAQLGALPPDLLAQLNRARLWARWASRLLNAWAKVCLMLLVAHALLAARTWVELIESPAQSLGLAGSVTLAFAPLLYGLAVAVSGPFFGPPGLAAEVIGCLGRAAAVRLALWGGGALAAALLAWGTGRLLRRGQPALTQTQLPIRRRARG